MNNVKRIALATALILAMPAMAQTFLQPLPKGAKYRDQGTKPATGRSGLAAIEARALLGRDGMTDIEVTTGHFEGIGGAGTLAKVQVKLFSGGALRETDNYRLGAAGLGTGTFSYAGLNRGYSAQVQANVSGIDPRRTDVVTVTTPVKRRPDLEAMHLNAQSRVVLNASVAIHGVIAETNGDVGARATCRLFADGVEIGTMAGIWIDANSTVSCDFRKSFATLGTKNLTLRVTDVDPRDDDGANNEASLAIEVVNSNVDNVSFYVNQWDWSETSQYSQVLREGGVQKDTYSEYRSFENHFQEVGAWSVRYRPLPLAGRITYRHASGGVTLPGVSVDVQELPDGWYDDYRSQSCRYGVHSSGFVFYFCTDPGMTEIDVGAFDQHVVYIEQKSLSGTGCCDWSSYSRDSWDVPGPRFTLGDDYTAELLHETAEGVFGGSLSFPIRLRIQTDVNDSSCSAPVADGWQTCSSYVVRETGLQGNAFY